MRRATAAVATALGVLGTLGLTAPASALAEAPAPRTAAVSGGVDPSLAYDVAAAQVALDPATGTLTLAVDLHAALPQPLPGEEAGVTLALAAAAEPPPGDASGDRCLPTAPGTSAGDTTAALAAAPRADGADEPPTPGPELTATATIAPDPLPRALTVTLSPDRRRLTATLVDPLLSSATPRCLVVRAHGRAAAAPADAPETEELSGWFDGERPPTRPPSDPPPAPSPPPSEGRAAPAPPTLPVGVPTRSCPARRPAALTWGDFPRELAVGGSALVPVQARHGREVSDVVATLKTYAGDRRLGPPLLVALPPRGYALKLQAPPQPGRLDAQLSWREGRDGGCADRSPSYRIAVVEPRAPRLTVAATARRLTLAWGLAGRDCHALLPRGLRVRVEGVGQRRDYRVAQPCEGFGEPGAPLPDVAARRDGARLQLSPLGEEPGLWRYRLSAVSSGRTLLRGDLLVEVAERGGAIVRTIRLHVD